MQDLISRQAAIDILYNFAGCIVDTPNGDYRKAYEASRYKLETLPSAQTEIVRCKDCKHRYLDGMIWNCPFGLSGGEDFFCAYGAKEGDSDDE